MAAVPKIRIIMKEPTVFGDGYWIDVRRPTLRDNPKVGIDFTRVLQKLGILPKLVQQDRY